MRTVKVHNVYVFKYTNVQIIIFYRAVRGLGEEWVRGLDEDWVRGLGDKWVKGLGEEWLRGPIRKRKRGPKGPPNLRRSEKEGGHRPPEPSCLNKRKIY